MTTTMVHRLSNAFCFRIALAAAVLLPAAALQIGCGGCGIGAVAGSDGDGGEAVAQVDGSGEVVFQPTPIGVASTFQLSVKDSAYTHETILGASFSGAGADAFTVVGVYPIDVPAGAEVTLQVSFAPTQVGAATATLMVQTRDMGVSPIAVTGTGVAGGG